MTRDELSIEVFERVLKFISGNYVEELLMRALKHNNNNVDHALTWLIVNIGDAPVRGGFYGQGLTSWELMGGYRSEGRAWKPTSEPFDDPPDLVFTYRDILLYLRNGKKKTIQLDMFEK